MEEYKYCTNVSSLHRGGAISTPLSSGGPKWRDNFLEASDHPVTPNRLEFVVVVKMI